MLGESIHDDIESGAGVVPGLGLLPVTTTFGRAKVLSSNGPRYQVHHGRVSLDECVDGAVTGTTWHGIFDDDEFRREFLTGLAAAAGRDFVATNESWAQRREQQLDHLADAAQMPLCGLVDELMNL